MTCNRFGSKLPYEKLVYGGGVVEGEWRDMINDRLEDSISELRRKSEMFKTWSKRSQELRTLIDEASIDESARKLLEEYFEVEFNIAATLQPAFYRQGMEDAIWILQTLGVL